MRRAAEFVALTLPPLGAPADDAETEALFAPLRLGPRVRVPESVEPGSAAHAACLAFPAPLLGLEASYFFNGSRQMDAWALLSALGQVGAWSLRATLAIPLSALPPTPPPRQVDAVLAAIAGGGAFDAATAMAAPPGSAAMAPWSAWRDASLGSPGVGGGGGAPAAPERSAADLRAALDAAARAASRGMPDGGDGGGGGMMGRVFGGSSALPAYARPQPLVPAQAVAVAAIVRGALSAALGRADEAAAAFGWLTETAASSDAGAAVARREAQAVAYAHYERAVLYADAAKALARRAAAARAPAAAAAAARRPALVLPCDSDVPPAGGSAAAPAPSATGPRRVKSGVPMSPVAPASPGGGAASPVSGAGSGGGVGEAVLASAFMRGVDRRQACKAGKLCLKASRDIRQDFNWKVSAREGGRG